MQKCRQFSICCAIIIAGCVSLPREEHQAVECAGRALVSTPGVKYAEVRPGSPAILRYAYFNSQGELVESQIRIVNRVGPEYSTTNYYEMLDDKWMRAGLGRSFDLRDSLAECNLAPLPQ